MKDYENMTVKELVDELTSRDIPFKKKARKAELIELLAAATGEEEGAPTPEIKDASAPAKEPEAEKPEPEKSAPEQKAAKASTDTAGYAIIRTGGKQYQVSAGSLIRVEKINGNVGDTIELKDVLAVINDKESKIGQPVVEGAVVTARIVEQDKAKKVLVFKKKRRKGYRVKRGHRQQYTALEISGISV